MAVIGRLCRLQQLGARQGDFDEPGGTFQDEIDLAVAFRQNCEDLNGLAAPPIMLLMLLASRTTMLGRWRSGWLSTTLVATAVLVMTGLPVWYLLS